jgi:uncharacterized OsmC-like protein
MGTDAASTGRSRHGFKSAQVTVIRDGLARRRTTQDRAGLRGLDRIEIDVLEGLEYEARNPHEAGRMRIGEPVDRGGSGEGSSPLSHVLAGAAACLLNQFIRLAAADDLGVRFAGTRSRVEFSRAVGGGFERIVTEIHGEGPMNAAAAESLVRAAEEHCYIHVTLRRAVAMTTVLVLDGEERVTSTAGPAGQASGVAEAR